MARLLLYLFILTVDTVRLVKVCKAFEKELIRRCLLAEKGIDHRKSHLKFKEIPKI